VSADSTAELQKFRDRYGLNFPLAGDPSHSMLTRYDIWQEKSLYGKKYMGIVRSTYIIAEDGRVQSVFPKAKVDGHVEEVLEALQK
jgi:thioredoxin-dependent peroxiredoxin